MPDPAGEIPPRAAFGASPHIHFMKGVLRWFSRADTRPCF